MGRDAVRTVRVGATEKIERGPWGLLALLVAMIAAITASICMLATPDFASIAAYRTADESAGAIVETLPAGRTGPAMLYWPQAAGAPTVSINGAPAIAPVSHSDARLTRSLQLLTLTLPAAEGPTRLLIAPSPGVPQTLAGPVFAGPREALQPVVTDQLRWGRAMQAAIPAAAWFAVGMSLLLIFFSRKPSKYVLLICAFTLQLIIELEVSPAWLGFQLNDYDRFLGLATQLLIWQAVAAWTGSAQQGRPLILGASFLALLAVAVSKMVDTSAVPWVGALVVAIQVSWLVAVQIANWRMVLSAEIASPLNRAGTLACFVLATSGVLAYRFLSLGGYSIGWTFFLSNWVNVASSLAVFAFVVGALVNEVHAYRSQRVALNDLSRLAAGHHSALSEQQQKLRAEIERNAVLEERQRFMRELHDGIGNQMLGLMIKLRRHGPEVASLTDDVQATIAELRLVTTALDDMDGNLSQVLGVMRQRLDAQAAGAGVALSWDIGIDPALVLPPKLVLDVLRIVQECISNALRHASATRVEVAIRDAGGLVITITDDGTGFDPAAVQAGLGLRNLNARAAAWGGEAVFGPGDGGGTRVSVALKIPA